MVHFLTRLGKDIIDDINEMIAKPVRKHEDENSQDNDKNDSGSDGQGGNTSDRQDEPKESDNYGKLILDATGVPADIHYPTDIWLLNTVREAMEEIIDVLHQPHVGTCKKPRTYRDCARRDYLNVDKKKHKTYKEIRKGIRQQLRYVKRDLGIIASLADKQISINNYPGIGISDMCRISCPIHLNLFTRFTTDMHGCTAFLLILLDVIAEL